MDAIRDSSGNGAEEQLAPEANIATDQDDAEWLGEPADAAVETAPDDEASELAVDVVIDDIGESEDILFAEVEEELPEVSDETGGMVEVLNLRIAEIEEEQRATQQRMLRLAADHENFKRRNEREKDEIRRFGIERLLVDLLPVMDNFERALSHGSSSQDRESLLQGVEMVRRQFENVLRKYGCEGFDSIGVAFDPQRHEAVHQMESPRHDPNTVIEEYHRGYYLQDRLIRPALVAVSKLPTASSMSEPVSADGEAEPAAPDTDGTVPISGTGTDAGTDPNGGIEP